MIEGKKHAENDSSTLAFQIENGAICINQLFIHGNQFIFHSFPSFRVPCKLMQNPNDKTIETMKIRNISMTLIFSSFYFVFYTRYVWCAVRSLKLLPNVQIIFFVFFSVLFSLLNTYCVNAFWAFNLLIFYSLIIIGALVSQEGKNQQTMKKNGQT